MEEKDERVKFWEILAQHAEGIAGGNRCLRKLKRGLWEPEVTGEEVLCLKEEGLSYQKALEMLTAELEILACQAKLEFAEKRWRLKVREFWLSVLEEAGLDDDAGLTFDAFNVRVLGNKSAKYLISDSLSPEGYKNLIMTALTNPLSASQMAGDRASNFQEIRHLAEVITRGDFKPNLRQMIECWAENPSRARESLPVLTKRGMPEWLVEIAANLGQRRKWNLN
jgi:hypothetical protein